jgi:hypothetical protein
MRVGTHPAARRRLRLARALRRLGGGHRRVGRGPPCARRRQFGSELFDRLASDNGLAEEFARVKFFGGN